MSDQNEGTEERNTSVTQLLLGVLIAIGAAVLFYSVTATAAADPYIRTYAISIGIALLVLLLIYGFIDKGSAKSGVLDALFTSIPNIYQWGLQSNLKAFIVGGVSILCTAIAIWVGPLSVKSMSFACDDAVNIKVDNRSESHACNSVLSLKQWISPLQRYKNISFECFDSHKNSWKGNVTKANTGLCGKRPLNASFITNGIDISGFDIESVAGKRTTEGVLRLRNSLNSLPDRSLKDRLLIATWNIRKLGSSKRMDESYAYIAEIISHFDVIAVQEVNDIASIDKLLTLLGGYYKAEFGFTAPGVAGNRERLGFVYDSRKVGLGRLSTTLVLNTGIDELPGTGQPSRPPFLAEFIVNGSPFFLVTTHVYFGMDDGERFERRIKELSSIGRSINKNMLDYSDTHTVILAGDLNFSASNGREMQVLKENGFETDLRLAQLGSYASKSSKPRDQIMILNSEKRKNYFGSVGIVNTFENVFRDNDAEIYKIDFQKILGEKVSKKIKVGDYEKYYKRQLRTFQISDHFPKWAEFRMN